MSFTQRSRLSHLTAPSSERQNQELRVTDYSKQLRLPLSEHVADYSQRDLDATEGFLRYLLMLESEPSSSLAKQLIRDGIELPEPESLDDSAVSQKLDEVIQGLVKLHTYLIHTDHLSDRELYEHLWWEALNEPEYEFDDGMGQYQTTIDLVGDGSESSTEIYHRYYADELDRDWWLSENPDGYLPDMEPAPYDRDRHLPRPAF